MSVGSAETAGEEETRAGAHGNPGKGFCDLFTLFRRGNGEIGVHFIFISPLCTCTIYIREILHQTFKSHFTPKIRPQRANAGHFLSRASAWTGCPLALPASYSKVSGRASLPGTGTWQPAASSAVAGQEVPRGHTPPPVLMPHLGGHSRAWLSLDGDSRETEARAALGLEFTPRVSKREHQQTACLTKAHSYY